MAKSQVPGYYRMMLGPVEVTALLDGALDIDTRGLQGASEAEVESLLARHLIDGPKVSTSCNAYLINDGERLVLIDAGGGTSFWPTLGRLPKNLEAAGYRPEQIDDVLITHLHPDHLAGLLDPSGEPAFPNATVHVPKADHDLWIAKAKSSGGRGWAAQATNLAAPYLAAGRWKTFDPGDSPVPGVKAVAAAGHTPGHTAFEIPGGDQTLTVWGDLVHCMAAQLARPDLHIRFDASPKDAVAARRALLDRLAADKGLIAGAHMPFPGIGRIRRDGPNAYTWLPVAFSSNAK